MSGKESVDLEKAKILIKKEWAYVESHPSGNFLDPKKHGTEIMQIGNVLQGNELTYRYILVTSALAKAVNPKIHFRALQKGSKLQGAYDARSVAHKVLVPFEKSHGERLGGSNEPFLNRPARYPEFALTNRDRNREAQNQLYSLLENSQVHCQTDISYPLAFLRQVLQEMIRLNPAKFDFPSPPVKVSLELTKEILDKFLSVSGSGERLVAVCAATFASLSEILDGQLTIKVYPVNWPDRFAKTAGDIEFYLNGTLEKAAEVKDKPVTEGDTRHCEAKARKHKLSDYIILYGAGIVKSDEEGIKKFIRSRIEKGINLYLFEVPQELTPFLMVIGEKGRSLFLKKVGEYLNEIKATRENKLRWKRIVTI
ncbi:restriction endonuclease, SacI family [Candidatus Bathyarchaeota archaeon]|nr:restriction endonuclease, SacI family [Candidatus Bathyarchaeota archaeon]